MKEIKTVGTKMVLSNFKNFIFKELIFPKTLIANYPGIIINKRVSKFSKNFGMMRIVYMFEIFAIDLYDETTKSIGKEKADFLWYKISKNSSFRHMLFSSKPKVPSFLIPSILEYIFQSLAYLGISFAEEFKFKDKSIVTYGKNCLACRKNQSSCIPAGILSAIWSYMHEENIEAKACCGKCPSECKIIANKDISKKYEIDYKKLAPIKNYNSLNFKDSFKNYPSGISFMDFIKFGKIKCNDDKKLYYNGKGLSYAEVGVVELIYIGYKNCGEIDLFNKILLKSASNLMKSFCSGNIEKDIHEMESLLSAFGWGIPIHLHKKDSIEYNFIHPPISKYPPMFRATILNGFLNCILKKRYALEEVTNSKMIFKKL